MEINIKHGTTPPFVNSETANKIAVETSEPDGCADLEPQDRYEGAVLIGSPKFPTTVGLPPSFPFPPVHSRTEKLRNILHKTIDKAVNGGQNVLEKGKKVLHKATGPHFDGTDGPCFPFPRPNAIPKPIDLTGSLHP